MTGYLESVERDWMAAGAGSARERGIGPMVAWWYFCRSGNRNEARLPSFDRS